ncbi:MAG: methyl-accepting chemotaxis protein [Magnetococcus sp. WYHC-3]
MSALLQRIRIGPRLGLGFAVLLLLLLVLSLYAIGEMRVLSGMTTKLYRHPFTVSTAALRVQHGTVLIQNSMKDVSLAVRPAQIEEARQQIAQTEKQIAADMQSVEERYLGDKQDVARIKDALDAWRPLREQVIALTLEGQREKAGAITQGAGAQAIETLHRHLGVVVNYAVNKAESFMVNAGKEHDSIVTVTVVLLVLALALGGILAWGIRHSIVVPLHRAVAAAGGLARGDLTVRFTTQGRDELAELMTALENMAGQLRDSFTRLKETDQRIALGSQSLHRVSNSLGSSAADLNRRAGETNTAARTMSSNMAAISSAAGQADGNMGTVTAAAEQASTNMSTISAAAEQASTNLSAVASAAEEAASSMAHVNESAQRTSQSVNTLVESVRTVSSAITEVRRQCDNAFKDSELASSHAENNAKVMDKLTASAQEIGKVVKLINDIANQTNMLALNASIEAAGAGEAGKGFAVVANEVKDLARQTSEATNMISQQVNQIRIHSGDVARTGVEVTRAIGEIKSANGGILNSVNSQGEAIREISAAVEEVSSEADEVSRRVRESAEGMAEVTRNVSEISAGIAEVTRSVAEASAGIVEMARNVSQASQGNQEITTRVGHAAQQSQQIVAQVTAVGSASQSLEDLGREVLAKARDMQQSSQELDQILSKFKL